MPSPSQTSRLLAAPAALAYVLVLVFGHGPVSAVADAATRVVGPAQFGRIITAVCLASAGAGLLLLGCRLRGHPQGRRLRAYLALTLVLAATAYNTLFQVNIEAVHFLAYAGLAVLFQVLTRDGRRALLLTLAAACVDEAYQFLVLYRRFDHVYFDFNDLVLNMIGAGLGLILWHALRGRIEPLRPPGPWFRNPVLIAAAVLLPAAAVLLLTGVVQPYPGQGEAAIVLSRAPAPPSFWVDSGIGKPYHPLHPFPGLVLVMGLAWVYGRVDRGRGREM